jgi:cell division cycle protein 20 (cofactor of APC complex)
MDSRIYCAEWKPNDANVIAIAHGNDRLCLRDVRDGACRPAVSMATEQDRACAVRWRPDGAYFLTGGNINGVRLWDARSARRPVASFGEYRAAVKGLAWCPYDTSTFVCGSGTQDRDLRLWRIADGKCLALAHTKAQVTDLAWSPQTREIVCSYGYGASSYVEAWSALCEQVRHATGVPVPPSGSGRDTLRYVHPVLGTA